MFLSMISRQTMSGNDSKRMPVRYFLRDMMLKNPDDVQRSEYGHP